MKTVLFIIYSSILAIGSALVGLVIGFMIKQPSALVASILVVIGLGFLAIAILVARRYQRGNRIRGEE
ncbi:MAG: hypothetical protein U9Q94_05625 [Candidatus Bipolaricaulota bacterium]|nr:hypothetical protein [Candidatus Bipolaricaulota bacterium]